MSIITINNVCKSYKSKKALDNVCLEIEQGELFGLLGVNGAGKTTLIKILCGLTRKTSGSVMINGYNLDKDIDKIKEIIDISPQETAIANNLTVKENLEFFAHIYNKKATEITNEIVEDLNLGVVLNQRAKTLSGGYKRRLSIGISLRRLRLEYPVPKSSMEILKP